MISYDITDLKRLAVYKEEGEETPDNIGTGKNITHKLSQKLRKMLNQAGDHSYGRDYSRQDSAIITGILAAGGSPEDTYTTFISSVRGKFCAERKTNHLDDYLQRTIKKSLGFLQRSKGQTNGHISVNFGRQRKRKDSDDGAIITPYMEVEAEKVRWLWDQYIPAGKITILAGDPGMGKSTIVIDLISRITRGTFLPASEKRTVPGTCIIASAEDAPEDTILPRLIVAETNLKRVNNLRQVQIEGETAYLSLPRDLAILKDAVIKHGARLLTIDPLNAFLEKGTDTYKDQDIRSVLAPLENIAEETGVAILIVAHLTKKEDASTLYRVGGSIGFIGAARSVLAVSRTPKDGIRALYSLKTNLGKTPPAIAYETVETQKVKQNPTDWLGEDKIRSSTIVWKGRIDFDPNSAGFTNEKQAETEAEEFLRQVLSDSEVATDDIYAEAKNAGISKSVLTRTKTALGIKAKKLRSGKWAWKFSD